MQGPHSLGYATDLMIAAFDGEVVRGSDYYAARTPTSPLFWWGNFVVFDTPPRPGQVAEWAATFDEQVGCVPGVQHRNLAWDTPPLAGVDSFDTLVRPSDSHSNPSRDPEAQTALDEFLAAGYQLNTSVVLTNSAPHSAPGSPITQVATPGLVRPIQGDAEWDRVLEIQQASLPSQRNTATFRTFQAQQRDRDRRLVGAGHGEWFGAFVQGTLAATMGLYVHQGVARCQSVATAPEFRRQGLCATLVHAVCETGLREMGADQIVILTTPGGAAERIYQSVGFVAHEWIESVSMGMTRTPKA